jgi:hypothetical protein
MQHIAQEMNKYYELLTQNLSPAAGFRLQNWKDTTPEELYIFFSNCDADV